MILYYAICHENGNYLPAHFKYPSGWEGEAGQFPRLFTKISHAKSWITNWRAGCVSIKRTRGYFNDYDYDDTRLEIIPKPHRANVKLEITPCTLTFGRLTGQ